MSGTVFISAKSEDYAHARVVYDYLRSQNVNCFFSDRTLMDRGMAAYRRVIDDALEAAVHMVVVTSSREYVKSNWVEYEWGFFHNELLSGRKTGNLITVLCGTLSAGVLPPSLRGYQTLHLEKELDRLPFFLPGTMSSDTRPEADPAPSSSRVAEAETFRQPPADPALLSLAAGQLIARRFRLKEVLGRGGMGVVWRAYDEDLRKVRALKFLREEYAGDPGSVAELKDEVGRCQELSHPHIIRVFELVRDDDRGLVAVSMEVAGGGGLTARRVQKPSRWFEWDELTSWVEQLCAALTYIHEEIGLVHRDLKPGNLLLDDRDRIKVSDFGISSKLTESLSRRTGDSPSSGTAAYMSPEQDSAKVPNASDDLYSLGATLYEMLTGQPPFNGTKLTVLAQLRSDTKPQSIAARRFALDKVAAPIPQEWEDVIAALLSKKAADRPQSAREVAERLRKVQATPVPVNVAPPSVPEPPPVIVEAKAPPPVVEPVPQETPEPEPEPTPPGAEPLDPTPEPDESLPVAAPPEVEITPGNEFRPNQIDPPIATAPAVSETASVPEQAEEAEAIGEVVEEVPVIAPATPPEKPKLGGKPLRQAAREEAPEAKKWDLFRVIAVAIIVILSGIAIRGAVVRSHSSTAVSTPSTPVPATPSATPAPEPLATPNPPPATPLPATPPPVGPGKIPPPPSTPVPVIPPEPIPERATPAPQPSTPAPTTPTPPPKATPPGPKKGPSSNGKRTPAPTPRAPGLVRPDFFNLKPPKSS